MPGNNNNLPQPPLRFLLDVIILEVKDAKDTHDFLCDVFAEDNPIARWPDVLEQPPQGSSLSPDGMHAIFRMGNTRIQFTTTASFKPSTDEHNARIAVLVIDIEKVKKVLDQHKVKYNHGRWEALPGRPRWIEFRDQDGYTWNISDLVRN
ncbi:hypothetical protein LA080_001315 [Diaporthe eres]|uniref:VOC domain-containing protein n=1 Tax=Diaporthe vaccinii TaxID=105482 RepID=A0ABR4E6Q5_9PEZI|nr:hypothetical protein LA080_001315 [Diaporthe eres]